METTNTTTISELALSIAISQLGQQEVPKGSNKGPMVDKYLASVGLNPGYAWCQAFVYWCYQEAAKMLKVKCPVIRTAGVQACWVKTDASLKILRKAAITNPALIKPGTQFIMVFDGKTGHTGIVERMEGNIIHTIEGNSNNNGSREGFAVVRHTRTLVDNALQGFILYK